MPNILDEAVQIANEAYLSRRTPNPAEMKRAAQLVQKAITGRATNTERIVLKGILRKIGVSEDQVLAAIQEEMA